MTDQLPVVLTAKDFALLDTLSKQWGEPFAGAVVISRRKLAVASVVFPTDVPADVVTLNSRVRFCVDGAQVFERVLIGKASEEMYGLTVLLASPRGLALIGARVGQTVVARRRDGVVEQLYIEAVLFQPEQRLERGRLKIVSRQDNVETFRALPAAPRTPNYARSRFGEDDDPGPSAA